MHAWDAAAAEGPPSAIQVRDAKRRDFTALLALWRELMDFHVEIDHRFELALQADDRFRTYFDTAMAREDYRIRLAEVSGHPAGFSVACVLPNSPVYRTRWIGYINDLCVASAMRRRGVGRALVRDAVGWLRKHGAESVEVYVAHLNASARAFWTEMGGQPYLHRMSIRGDLGDE